jgi:hypothetical protein
MILLMPMPAFGQSMGCTILVDWAEVEEGLDTLFFGACTRHDQCYRTCNPEGGPFLGYGYKATCDTVFYGNLHFACNTWSLVLSFPNVRWVNREEFLDECVYYANYAYAAVLSVGTYFFLTQQCQRCNVWACNQGGGVYSAASCMLLCGGLNRDDCELRPWGYDCPPCPIGLDLQANGLKLTGPVPAVQFDLDADGTPDHTSWTRKETKDGWLVLDRDQNGRIDDGRELFGNATPLLLSTSLARHGYEVLEEFDRTVLGGNEDGVIDHHDGIFEHLQVWLDKNRDAVTQDGELVPLSELGVVAISLSYFHDEREDQWGNVFQWWSPIYFENGSESMSVDVFFNRLPE